LKYPRYVEQNSSLAAGGGAGLDPIAPGSGTHCRGGNDEGEAAAQDKGEPAGAIG